MGLSLQRRLAAGALLTGLVAAAGSAHADPTAADRESARALMQEGRDLRDKGSLKEALTRFKAANDVMHVPTTALEVARVQAALGLLVEARDTLAALRQMPVKPTDPAPFREARDSAEILDQAVSAHVPSIKVTVTGTPEGQEATLSVDGAPIQKAFLGLPRAVDPGHHVIKAVSASAAGQSEVDVRDSEKKDVTVAMVPTPVAPADDTPPAPEQPPPPPERSHAPTLVTWIGVGVGGAGLVTGSIAGLLSMSKKSKVAGECPNDVCGPSAYSDLDSASSLATVSDVGFALFGAGAAVAVVSLVLGHDDEPSAPATPATGVRVVPWLTGRAGGVMGSF